jgi:hypothetical protein
MSVVTVSGRSCVNRNGTFYNCERVLFTLDMGRIQLDAHHPVGMVMSAVHMA